MPFQKGHKINEGNHDVGRKTKAEEIETAVKNKVKKIKQKKLNDLSRTKVYKVIKDNNDKQTVKEFALPIVLKTMTEKHDHTTKGESINLESKKVSDKAIADYLNEDSKTNT